MYVSKIFVFLAKIYETAGCLKYDMFIEHIHYKLEVYRK